MKKVTLKEIVGSKIILAVCIAAYYWCWARNDWHDYYDNIQHAVGTVAVIFFVILILRVKQYKKEVADEMAITNLRRCDSICLKIVVVAMIVISFLSAIFRFTYSAEITGYMLMGLLVVISVVRTIIFGIMDSKGV